MLRRIGTVTLKHPSYVNNITVRIEKKKTMQSLYKVFLYNTKNMIKTDLGMKCADSRFSRNRCARHVISKTK